MCDQQSRRSACAYAQSNQSLCLSLEYSLTLRLQTEPHLEFLGLKGGFIGLCESTLVKMPHCWKPHIMADIETHLSFAESPEENPRASFLGLIGNASPLGNFLYILKVLLIHHFILKYVLHASIDIA